MFNVNKRDKRDKRDNREEVVLKPLQVEVKNNNFEGAAKIFKNLVQNDGCLLLYREKMSYEKPSDRKRRKNREAIEMARIQAAREESIQNGTFEKKRKAKEKKRLTKLKKRNTTNA